NTQAPMAPRTRSSHMNKKRSWPGVPNRYNHKAPGRAMRPKSIATVVVVLRSVTPPASSTPTECSVMAASVLSGSMSEIDPMKVVLPTANPPAITILTTVGATCGSVVATDASEGCDAIEDTLQKTEGQATMLVMRRRVVGRATYVNGQMIFLCKVGNEHPHHAQRKPGVGREFSH